MNTVDVAPEKTRADLEWGRLLEALAARCETALGKDLARAIDPSMPIADVHRTIAQVQESIETAQQGEPLPVTSLPDAREAHARVEVGGVLSAIELRAVTQVLAGARAMRRFLHARRAQLPALEAACGTDPSLDRVEDEIARAFDPDGTLADHASPRLRQLRSEYAASRARMISRIEEIMRRYAAVLSDTYWTEREGRYVLPMRADAHERFPGLVHGSSGSGATLFVEPRVVIPLGNRLKMLEGEVRREEEAIYAHLTGRVAAMLASVRGAIEAMGRADLCAASAKLARELSLTYPVVPDATDGDPFVADLKNLRHPLLLLEALEAREPQPVVPSDVRIAAGRALVVSGPNAGGKTVALKALGLSALMLRSGLPVAADTGSSLGLVDVVLTDVGDDQSLQKSLSTFSAHVTNLARILDAARPAALVLLDELAGGTDPREGEALAAAVLDALCRRGAAVVATTHYEGLKALALADRRFQNASVGFDMKTLSPTFRLALGIPGASSALSVARRFGIPSLVIERAETYLSGEERTFEDTVKGLNDERRAMELARAAAEAELAEVRLLRGQIASELEELRARDKRIVQHEAEALLAAVRRARDDVRSAQARIRAKKPEQEAVAGAEKSIDSVAGRFAIGGDLGALLEQENRPERGAPLTDDTTLRKGAKVYVTRLRAEAEVVDVQGDGQLRVAAGALKLTIPRSDVRVLVDGPREGALRAAGGARAIASSRAPRLHSSHRGGGVGAPMRAAGPSSADPSAEPEVVLQTTDNTCDVRGLRVDDAWPMVETFLDRSLNEGRRLAIVVHGHGSGALRDRVRLELTHSQYVARYRAGRPAEGGDGVTVVWLR
jgi:DNA mismatch repair protein MutS2